jgi:hypothetical protein
VGIHSDAQGSDDEAFRGGLQDGADGKAVAGRDAGEIVGQIGGR